MRKVIQSVDNRVMWTLSNYPLEWYGFRLVKGQTDTVVSEIGSDAHTIRKKPINTDKYIYPAAVKHDGIVNYKLGGITGNNLTKKRNSSESSNLDGTDGEIGTMFESFYYRVNTWSDDSNTYEDWMFSEYPLSGFSKSPRFFMGIYPASYDSTNDKLQSIANAEIYTNETRGWYRQRAANLGSGWCITPYFMYNILMHLLFAERLNINSQENISLGATNAGSTEWDNYNLYNPVWTSGGESAPDSGTVTTTPTDPNTADVRIGEIPLTVDDWGDGTKTLNTQMAVIWHIRDLYGHLWEFQDGINPYNSSAEGAEVFTSHKVSDFADDTETGYEKVGNIAENDGYTSKFLQSHVLPTEVAGSSSDHCGDYHYSYFDDDPDSGWRVARVGGYLGDGSLAGLSCFRLDDGSSVDASYLGARLCKIL